jgi:hypothetical protein
LIEENISLKDLFVRLYNPTKVLGDEFGFVDK